ncbi:host attachment protein [Zavarzinia compransoris]|uniref:Host attachment protein n=1 Tax=Zavarzinia compransoris TaxID=1264899 RepID=A0A317E445_9PROT|nr:host attachment protein [Zavarzinia compransoris]PWR19825.1 hypothetical protein DKG75_15315 [Zavarzinia compransoris]TDP45068.1 protein required for attachment to host cells [Zavarzinia compransoris]
MAVRLSAATIAAIGKGEHRIMPRLPSYWVLLADGVRARLFEGTRPFKDLHPVEGAVGEGAIGADRESADGEAGGGEPQGGGLAKVLASRLDAAARAGRFDRLVIVAPAPVLGDIRTLLGASARARLNAAAGLDLTGLPMAALPAALLGILGF